ncbi:hypothetical protein BROUX41_000511 [Berkeleyomyces rouxiae]
MHHLATVALSMATLLWSSRYPRYDGGDPRRSRSRSPDRPERYERMPPYNNEDRRRSSAADQRTTGPPFQSMRSDIIRDVPRGPKALQPPDSLPNAPRGGYGGDFSRGRGRPRGGRGWARDDSRERGRDMDFRDRNAYRGEERSRDRERDRDRLDRDRDWREHHDRPFRNRRPSPPVRGRSPPSRGVFSDRDSQLSLNLDRARGTRDGGPPSAGSATSDTQFGPPSYSSQRGGFNSRGRGRGGRGDWDNRPRGRYFNDDHRFNRSRSQEGRWNNRDRDRDDRFPDFRDRDDRDFRDRDSGRPRLERPAHSHDNSPINPKETTSPPPLTPGAGLPHFVPRNPRTSDGNRSSLPHPPKTLPERPGSAGHGSVSDISMASGSPTLPPGPKNPRGFATSNWGSNGPPNKKIPESPGVRLPPRPFPGSYPPGDEKRPRSSDAKSDPTLHDMSHSRLGDNVDARTTTSDANLTSPVTLAPKSAPIVTRDVKSNMTTGPSGTDGLALIIDEPSRIIRAPVVRFQLPPTEPPPPPPIFEAEAGSIEDEEEDPDIGDYVTDEITKAEATMRGLVSQGSPWEIIRLFSYLSHEALTEIVTYEPDLPYLHTCVPEQIPEKLSEATTQGKDLVTTQAFTLESNIPIHDKTKDPVDLKQQDTPKQDGENIAVTTTTLSDELSKDPQDTTMQDTDNLHVKSQYPSTKFKAPEKDHLHTDETLQKQEQQDKTSLAPSNENFDVEMTVDSPSQRPISSHKPTVTAVFVPNPPSVKTVSHESTSSVGNASSALGSPSIPVPAQTPVPIPILSSTSMNPSSIVTSRPEPLSVAAAPIGAESKLTPPAESTYGNETETGPEMDVDGEIDHNGTGTASTPSSKLGMKTPPLDSLPDFSVSLPWFEDELVLDSLKDDSDSTQYVFDHLSKQEASVYTGMNNASLEFRHRLINYFDFTRSEDPAAIRSRGKFSINGGLDDSEPSSSSSSRKPEGRTRRFASERDLQRILAASIKEDEERKERAEQLKKDQCRNDEKEAVVPDMIWGPERRENMRFLDNSGYIPVRDTVAIWQCLPPIPNFTDTESDLFVKAYLERPKQWGMIAEAIPKRDFRSCIQYYYIKKRELDLKTKLKKQPRRRRKAVKKTKTAPLQDDAENEENQDTNENGERRRPRRAAAPTFGEQAKQAAEEKARAEGVATPEKTDVRRKRKTAKEREKEKEQQREAKAASKAGTATPQPQSDQPADVQSSSSANQTESFSVPSTPAPPTPVLGTTKGSGKAARSRSSSHAHHTEARASVPGTPQVHGVGIDRGSATPAPVHTPIPLPTMSLQQPQPQTFFAATTTNTMTPIAPAVPFSTGVSLLSTSPPAGFCGMATAGGSAKTPTHTPGGTPQPQPQAPATTTAISGQSQTSAPSTTGGERRQGNQPSSYWSVPEMDAFPGLLAHFGTNWSAMATFMTSKTATMVKNMYARDKDKSGRKTHWEAIAKKADEQRANGEPRPDPPAIQLTTRRTGPRGGASANAASASTTASAAASPVIPNAPGIETPKLAQPEPPTSEISPVPSPVKEVTSILPTYGATGTGRPIVPMPLSKMSSNQPTPASSVAPPLSAVSHQRHPSHSTVVGDSDSIKGSPNIAPARPVAPPIPIPASPLHQGRAQPSQVSPLRSDIKPIRDREREREIPYSQQRPPTPSQSRQGPSATEQRPHNPVAPLAMQATDVDIRNTENMGDRTVENPSAAASRVSMKPEPDMIPSASRYDPYPASHPHPGMQQASQQPTSGIRGHSQQLHPQISMQQHSHHMGAPPLQPAASHQVTPLGAGPTTMQVQSSRPEPTGLARPPAEAPRSSMPPGPEPGPSVYGTAQQSQMRNILRENVNTTPPAVAGNPMPGPPRPISTLSQRPSESYADSPKPAPAPAKKTSSLMSLLNDDGPPSPPKPTPVASAVASSLRPRSNSPAPQAVSSRNSMAPPTGSSSVHVSSQLRREAEPASSYYSHQNTASISQTASSSAMQPLKQPPYSPPPQHAPAPRQSSVMEAASALERDYYSGRPYPPVMGSNPRRL